MRAVIKEKTKGTSTTIGKKYRSANDTVITKAAEGLSIDDKM